jgi:hypothetical protein
MTRFTIKLITNRDLSIDLPNLGIDFYDLQVISNYILSLYLVILIGYLIGQTEQTNCLPLTLTE